mmetsp:Transcript_51257/g.133104  ORF Transcript_51257/g.133104 Transcript_51257/m.133104 type:complete len:373 (-) Transcript_51257:209-1327(-)
MGNGASLDGLDFPQHGHGMPQHGPAPNRNSGRDFYATLGLGRNASEEDIKKGYRKAAIKWHPDKWSSKTEEEKKDAEEKFKAAAEAYEILSDKNKKEIYDKFGEDGLKASSGAGPSARSNIVPVGAPGGVFMGSCGPGMSFSFTCGASGMSGSRAEQIFASFFSGGDPFAGFDDEDGFFQRRAPPRRQDPLPLRVDLLPRETTVKLTGLSKASLNESIGTIIDFVEERGRYTVRLRDGGNEVAIKPLNVRQVITGARIDRATSEHYGFSGSISGSAVYDTLNACYMVTNLPSSDIIGVKVKPENLILPEDTRVTAVGLLGRPELNGKAGRIVGADGGERYVVEMAVTGEQMKLKYSNVVALHGHNPWVGQFG